MSVNQTTYGTYPYNDAGDLLNTWGDDATSGLNQTIKLMSEGVHRVVTHTVTADFTLTTTSNASNEQRAIGHILAGSPAAAFTMTVASSQSRFWCITNPAKPRRLRPRAAHKPSRWPRGRALASFAMPLIAMRPARLTLMTSARRHRLWRWARIKSPAWRTGRRAPTRCR